MASSVPLWKQMSFFNSKCASLSLSLHSGLHHWGISKSKQGGHKPHCIASCYRKRGECITPVMGILNAVLPTNITNRTFCIFIYFIPTAILDKLYEGENFPASLVPGTMPGTQKALVKQRMNPPLIKLEYKYCALRNLLKVTQWVKSRAKTPVCIL